eukprot:CAMPEP_0194480946 /NCGR_PEP_ID=MMETSP0253-20130528/3582_1 /TAXON_ID=2966 /ORGANISM="Noctiluca scintillans" /LENGTH=160 /DNA_ID=CAMNT_0039320389 /DNA_START=59 /DNA_END=541 /DNA_ORIENTATION=+
MPTVTLDDDDLDEEDLKILREVKKKGYYHGRPPSTTSAPPQRIDTPIASSEPQRIDATTATVASSGKPASRRDFDAFQKKWDRFNDEDFVEKCASDSLKSGSRSSDEQHHPARRRRLLHSFFEGTPDVTEIMKWFDPFFSVLSLVSRLFAQARRFLFWRP